MKRSISTMALLFSSVSAILGSGWLFTAYYTSIAAGPSAIISWILGGAALAFVAFTFAETSAMLPVTGSSTRIPQYTHGTLVSFMFAWMIWLSYAALAPTEVQAVIQYLSYYYPSWVHTGGGLTQNGYIAATIFMLVISAINVFSLRWLMRCNSFLTILKLLIPIVVSVVLLVFFFQRHEHLSLGHEGFFPMGWHGILAALTTGGVVFGFNGFKQACEMAGEAKRPSFAIPFAVIGSIVICLIVYLLLQVAFLASLHDQDLMAGWAHLHLIGGNSPFASILSTHHMPIMITVLYAGAIIGPLAAALMYMSSASRSLYAMSKNDYLPLIFQKLSADGNPVIAIIVSFFFGMLMFAPLPGWEQMITFLTSLVAITYAVSPICLLALRDQAPDLKRPFKLPFVTLWSFLSFYVCTLMAYWSGWLIISKMSIALVLGLIILFVYHFGSKRGRELEFHWKASIWIWPYLAGISLLSYLGNFGHGLGVIPFGWDFATMAAFCAFIQWLAQRYKLPAKTTQSYIQQLNL